MTKLEDWIDYMEGEANLKEMAKLGLLIEHSAADRQILTNLMRVREIIRLSDPADEIETQISKPSFMAELQCSIISEIKSNSISKGKPAVRRSGPAPQENSSTLD